MAPRGSRTGAATESKAGPAAGVADPVLPRAWADLADLRTRASVAGDMSCEVYLQELVRSVCHRLHAFLSKAPAVGGIELKGALEQQQPLTIKPQGDVESQVHLRTYKEHWRWKSCKMSLEATGLYEAPGNLFWLSTNYPQWKGQRVPGMDMSYGELAGGARDVEPREVPSLW